MWSSVRRKSYGLIRSSRRVRDLAFLAAVALGLALSAFVLADGFEHLAWTPRETGLRASVSVAGR